MGAQNKKRQIEEAIIRVFLGRHFSHRTVDPSIKDSPDFALVEGPHGEQRVAVEITRLTSEKVMEFYRPLPSGNSRQMSYPLEWHWFFRNVCTAKKIKVQKYKENARASECWLLVVPTFVHGDSVFDDIARVDRSEIQCLIGKFPLAPLPPYAKPTSAPTVKPGQVSVSLNMKITSRPGGEARLRIGTPDNSDNNDMINFGEYVFGDGSHGFEKVFLWHEGAKRFHPIYEKTPGTSPKPVVKPEYQHGIAYPLVISTANQIEVNESGGYPISFPKMQRHSPVPCKLASQIYFKNFSLGTIGALTDMESLWPVLSFQIIENARIREGAYKDYFGPILVDLIEGKRKFHLLCRFPDGSHRCASFSVSPDPGLGRCIIISNPF